MPAAGEGRSLALAERGEGCYQQLGLVGAWPWPSGSGSASAPRGVGMRETSGAQASWQT
jgi:hypothetical protein